MKPLLMFAMTLLFAVIQPLNAEERYDHFPALDAPDIPTALCHIQNYNALLSELASKPALTAEDMVKVHELTYTLENALILLNRELTQAAVELEEVHLASERLDQATIKQSGDRYLQTLTSLMNEPACSQ